MVAIPEYMRVRQYIVDLVQLHPNPDEKIMSERELSAKLNVARITVRRALKALVDDGWLYKKPRQGMYINPDMCRNHANYHHKFYKVMVIWGDGKNVYIDGFFMDIQEHLCATFKRLPILLQNINLISEDQTLEEIMMYKPDGIIWHRPPAQLTTIIKELRDNIPVCLLGGAPTQDDFAVTVDYYEAGRMLAEWFLKRNLMKSAFVGAVSSPGLINLVMTGWLDKMRDGGVTDAENRMIYSSEDVAERVEELLGNGVDGIFTFGHLLSAVDFALSKKEMTCPVVSDENYYGDFGATHKPVAKIQLNPAGVTITAAEHMFRKLTESDYKTSEVVFKPEIINLSKEEL